MASDFESGIKKTIDLSVQSEKMTADILKTAMQEFLSGKAEKKGRMTYRQLEKKSHSKLESIEVTENNISDFLDTARKYDVDYALKKDTSTQPPTYHVFFSADRSDSFKKAFTEYAGKMQDKTQKRGEITREQIKHEASRVADKSRRKHKQREKTRETQR